MVTLSASAQAGRHTPLVRRARHLRGNSNDDRRATVLSLSVTVSRDGRASSPIDGHSSSTAAHTETLACVRRSNRRHAQVSRAGQAPLCPRQKLATGGDSDRSDELGRRCTTVRRDKVILGRSLGAVFLCFIATAALSADGDAKQATACTGQPGKRVGPPPASAAQTKLDRGRRRSSSGSMTVVTRNLAHACSQLLRH